MVKARKAAANQLAARPSITTEIPDMARPKASASPSPMRPEGTGRDCVRFMMRSISASHHMFSAPDAPPPSAMNRIAQNPTKGCTATGATSRPVSAVNTTSDMTRGLSKAT